MQQILNRHYYVFMAILASLAILALTVFSPFAPKVSAGGECGSGYSLVGSYPIRKSNGTRTATLEVYWNSSAKKNCAINRAYGSNYGVRMLRIVGIRIAASGQTWKNDSGYYYYYAGPVYTPTQSSGQCIDVRGSLDDGLQGSLHLTGVHCG